MLTLNDPWLIRLPARPLTTGNPQKNRRPPGPRAGGIGFRSSGALFANRGLNAGNEKWTEPLFVSIGQRFEVNDRALSSGRVTTTRTSATRAELRIARRRYTSCIIRRYVREIGRRGRCPPTARRIVNRLGGCNFCLELEYNSCIWERRRRASLAGGSWLTGGKCGRRMSPSANAVECFNRASRPFASSARRISKQ